MAWQLLAAPKRSAAQTEEQRHNPETHHGYTVAVKVQWMAMLGIQKQKKGLWHNLLGKRVISNLYLPKELSSSCLTHKEIKA